LKKSPNFENKMKQILAQIVFTVKNRLGKFENILGAYVKMFSWVRKYPWNRGVPDGNKK